MLLRLVILGVMAVGLLVGYRKWRGPPLLRVPFIWKSVSRRHSDVAEALRIRAKCGRILLGAPPARAEAMMVEIDKVVIEIVHLARTREARGVGNTPGETSKGAVEVLEALYDQLNSEHAVETEDALDRLRSRVSERAEDLRAATAVRREIDD